MTTIRLTLTGRDLKEINQRLLEVADSVALEYESYLQNPEERAAYYSSEGQSIEIDDVSGNVIYGYLLDPVVPEEHWSYVLHSGKYRSTGGKHICDGGSFDSMP